MPSADEVRGRRTEATGLVRPDGGEGFSEGPAVASYRCEPAGQAWPSTELGLRRPWWRNRSDSGSCVWLPGNHEHQWTRPDGVGRPSASQQASQIAWRACANGSQPSSKNAVLNRSAASMSAAVVTSYSPLVTASFASSVRTHVTETEAACGSRARIT